MSCLQNANRLAAFVLIGGLLSGCSYLSAFTSALGGGSGVNANAQVGAENNQAVAQVETGDEISLGDNSSVTVAKSDTTNEVTGKQINNNSLPWWVWVLIGWMIPTPGRILCENIKDWRECRRPHGDC